MEVKEGIIQRLNTQSEKIAGASAHIKPSVQKEHMTERASEMHVKHFHFRTNKTITQVLFLFLNVLATETVTEQIFMY